MGERRVDLHLHSDRSDGSVPPREVARYAARAGLCAFALTDHDTVDGIAEARAGAVDLDLEMMSGIEVSAYDERWGAIHVLGYLVDETAPDLLRVLDTFRARRAERARQMVERLNRLGIGVTFEDVAARSRHGLIARPHVAAALLDGGWVRSWEEAFHRFLATGRPAYVPTRHATPTEAIALIHGAGGLAVLAHPGSSIPEKAIAQLRAAGLDGLEVWHPEHGPALAQELDAVAARLGLLRTGGSDWHGPLGPPGPPRPPGPLDAEHGGIGSQLVPYRYYEELRAAAARAAPA